MEGNAQVSVKPMEDDDLLYRQVVAIASKPRNPPPSYESSVSTARRKGKESTGSVEHIGRSEEETDSGLRAAGPESVVEHQEVGDAPNGEEQEVRVSEQTQEESKDASSTSTGANGGVNADTDSDTDTDSLPPYSCDIHIEGVFKRKMEMVDTTKRARDRRWATNFVQLHGTALNIYTCKKESWASGAQRTKDIDAYTDEQRGQSRKNKAKGSPPKPSPDNPPWMSAGVLERRYNLSYADVGIAADYMKRRYVIRVRAETDQFLLSCFELGTLVAWLDALYAAIGVAAPIDQREFPRDHSTPRLQRLRWLRQNAVRTAGTTSGDTVLPARLPSSAPVTAPIAASSPAADPCPTPTGTPTPPPALPERTVSAPLIVATSLPPTSPSPPSEPQSESQSQPPPPRARSRLPLRLGFPFQYRTNSSVNTPSTTSTNTTSTTSPRHECLDRETGKWRPRHRWSQRHDHVYAKLCYGVLLFRSPRKSNYVVGRGGLQEWFVDWATGRMVRVSPPGYGEVDMSMTVGNGMGRAR